MMRGKITKIFTEKVTHLITTEVGSAKYHVIIIIFFTMMIFVRAFYLIKYNLINLKAAAGIKIPVMLPDWVLDIWKTSENE
jgi:hypothetical protein